jgi:bifunctional DNase/RNase
LKENTYYARVYVRAGDRQLTFDARPSDAISLALRTKSPIYVAKAVREAASGLQQMDETRDPKLTNV